ncbi:hypothetical protein PMI16_02142 [Herbaspirillum sp. CF444]|uniref:hypothetical protein n=1 Tax=Herbaspirillum sp. CF444 TaxID=1144319 RepID=UPI00027268D1|nr:hypothetical protein [Herbaspirillum sp. CF444]EJL88994.1 hypothetical protein PMI16_02142 [Herbaspirillum sp. CF444]
MTKLIIHPAQAVALPRYLHLLRLYKALILQSEDHNQPDMSVTAVNRLLQDLIALAGQQVDGPPALELQLGEVFTRSAVERGGVDHYLSVTALLPKCEQPHYLPLLHAPLDAAGADAGQAAAVDFLWHADEGRYIVVRKIPIRLLSDERSVMDAILATADIAGQYLEAVRAGDAG